METEWRRRVWREWHAGSLTRTWRDVLLTLESYCRATGEGWPSHTTLAERAGCSVRSVRYALAEALRLKLVEWTSRERPSGRQTSHRYRLTLPAEPVAAEPAPRPWKRPGCKMSGPGKAQRQKKEGLQAWIAEAARAGDLLKARQAAVRSRLARQPARGGGHPPP